MMILQSLRRRLFATPTGVAILIVILSCLPHDHSLTGVNAFVQPSGFHSVVINNDNISATTTELSLNLRPLSVVSSAFRPLRRFTNNRARKVVRNTDFSNQSDAKKSNSQKMNYLRNKLKSNLPFRRKSIQKQTRGLISSTVVSNRKSKVTSPQKLAINTMQKTYIRVLLPLMLAVMTVSRKPFPAFAMAGGGGPKGPVAPMSREQVVTSSCLFLFLFSGLALLHAAEIAITTLYPWKVREFAEEEEKNNPNGGRGTFKILDEDITRVLTTILVTSTMFSIYATTIFTHVAAALFGTRGETWGAVALTAVTLFFVELLPKSIGVTNAERVARFMVPPINLLSFFVSPLGIALSWLSKQVIYFLGLGGKDGDTGVSDSELRLIVMGARESGTIDHSEGEMIKGVLNLQSQRVKEIMRPRVDIVAVPTDLSVASVLGVVRESGYSRIPVYDGEIDNIVGIILAKSVLDFFVKGVFIESKDKKSTNDIAEEKEDSLTSYSLRSASGESTEGYVRALTGTELGSRMEMSITDADLIEECYFVPDTANGWAVLEEMRKRRIHMAIVVDEYGGTEGLVSLEDIVEEVVGEIYDEDDENDFEFTEDSITLQEDGTFIARGDADLEDCDLILGLNLDEEDTLKEFGTLSGFLCMCAGEIPRVGDFVLSRGWCFEVTDADPKKILTVKVERLLGCFENESETEDNAVLGFLKGNRIKSDSKGNDAGDSDSNDDAAEATKENKRRQENIEVAERVLAENSEEATRIDRMVDDDMKKKNLVKESLEALKQDQV